MTVVKRAPGGEAMAGWILRLPLLLATAHPVAEAPAPDLARRLGALERRDRWQRRPAAGLRLSWPRPALGVTTRFTGSLVWRPAWNPSAPATDYSRAVPRRWGPGSRALVVALIQ